MKNILALAACVCALAVSAYGQGTVNFNNRVTAAGLDAAVFDVGGTTKLAGPDAYAQMYVGGVAVGAPVAFRTGTGAGYFGGGTVAIPSVALGGDATVVVKAWKGAAGSTFDAATVRGESAAFTVKTGGNGEPPAVPANLVGLTTFTLQMIPEPSTIALGLLGAAALLIRRRR